MILAKRLWITPSKSFLLSTLPFASFTNCTFILNHIPSVGSDKMSLMRNIFNNSAASPAEETWDNLWKEGATPWDLGGPTSLLQNELKLKLNQDQWHLESSKSFRSLVPGCGSAYDLHTIAEFHDSLLKNKTNIQSTVVGLDISITSLQRSHQVLSQLLSSSSSSNKNSDTNLENIGDGSTAIQLYHGNFFTNSSEWTLQSSLTKDTVPDTTCITHENQFDFIFDYTFFCAIHPDLRSQWTQQMAQLLKPHGKLLTLIFPIFPKDSPEMLAMDGPPYPVSIEVYKKVLEPLGFVMMPGNPYESEFTVSRRQGKEMVCWWTKVHEQIII